MAAREARGVLAVLACGLCASGLAAGCSLLGGSERSFLSNRAALESSAAACGFAVEDDGFELEGIDLREDSLTFLYRGRRFPGDHAWVVRFSEKSTEQDPVALADIYSFLPVLAEGRRSFTEVDRGEVEAGGERLRHVRYRFVSPITDERGEPLAGHGILASLRLESPGGPLIFQIKLDNHGDRTDLGPADLAPFLEAARATPR